VEGALSTSTAGGQVRTFAGSDGYQMRLHDDRVEFAGGEGSRTLWGSIPLTAVTGIAIDQRPRDRGLLAWGLLGLLAALGIFAVASKGNVRNLGAFAVAAISGGLLVQYYFRPPGLQLLVQAGASARGLPIRAGDISNARTFALEVLQARDRLTAKAEQATWRRLPRYPIA
jgi:hypothetical protein